MPYRYEIDDPDFVVYAPAEDRVGGLGFDPSHHWTYFAQGDCFDSNHAHIECSRCHVMPLPGYCYHELGHTSEETARMLAARKTAFPQAAFEPCPGDTDQLEDR